MKVSGFTFIRNAVQFDYPIVEAILSILPICDEVVVAVGNSADDTLQLVKNINSPKIKIIETIWDESLREGGKVLAVETDKALAAVSPDSDWAFYIQGDEVMPEQYLQTLQAAMLRHKDDPEVEGLLVSYLHFYGSYQYVADSRQWYRHEIRIIRNNGKICSYKDAQGFRTKDNRKLRVAAVDVSMYHYGWVREPFKMRHRNHVFYQYWTGENKAELPVLTEYDYNNIDSLALFEGQHPAVMKDRIARMNWKFEPDIRVKKLKFKNRVLQWIAKQTGIRIGEYKNYVLLKNSRKSGVTK